MEDLTKILIGVIAVAVIITIGFWTSKFETDYMVSQCIQKGNPVNKCFCAFNYCDNYNYNN